MLSRKIPLCFRREVWNNFPFSDIIVYDHLHGRKIQMNFAISAASSTFY